MRRLRHLPLALLVHAALVLPAPAQVGQRVTEVRVEQEGRAVTDPVVSALIQTAVGQPLSMADVRATIARLWSLGRYEDIRSSAEPVADGVRILFELVPVHAVDRVEFRGALGLAERDLRRLVADRFGAAPAAGRAAELVEALRQAYAERGYAQASISARIEETHDPDRASLVVDVDAGPRARIASVRIVQTDAEVPLVALGLPEIRPGAPYDAAAVDGDLRRWEERMRARGYYEARASQMAEFAPDATSAIVTLSVRRGPRVVVAFAGDPIPPRERDRLVPIREEASADEDLLEDAARAIERYLLARGYRDARVQYVPEERGEELRITFQVTRGPRHVIREVRFEGASALPAAELRRLMGLREGDPFVQAGLDAGARAIAGAYRAAGFIDVRVAPEVDVQVDPAAPADRAVLVTAAVVEGPQTLVRSLTVTGSTVWPEAQVAAWTGMGAGSPYSEAQLAAARDRIELEYRNRGYESAIVEVDVSRTADGAAADVRLRVTEGEVSVVDHILIVGNTRTSGRTIERELLLAPGQPLGFSALVESRARLAALGLFRRIDIEPLQQPGGRRDILVRVTELDPTTFGIGGGVEGGMALRTSPTGEAEERFEIAPRGFVEIGRRNLWGKNRSVNLFSRVSLRPRDLIEGGRPVEAASGYGFNEYRVVSTFREPRVLDTRADLQVIGIIEQAIRSSFNFSRRELRAEAGLVLSPLYRLLGRYSFQRTELFDEKFGPGDEEQPLIDRLFPQVRLSKFAGSFIRDTRDDLLDPTRGALFITDVDIAARGIGSEVGFAKALLQLSWFRRLPGPRRLVFGAAGRLGVARGFPREVVRTDDAGRPVVGPGGDPIVERVDGLPASERFFAGGGTSVRGFALDRLGNERTIGPTGFPTGGNSVVVGMSELRVNVFGNIDAAGFFDIGNVFPRAGDLDLADLRPAAGLGIRYRSPIGPLRVDVGFNLDRRELVPGRLERGAVWHFSFGQAF